MGSPSDANSRRRIVVDNIHGDIALSELEWRVVNTASYQRLRSLKQKGDYYEYYRSIGMIDLVEDNQTAIREWIKSNLSTPATPESFETYDSAYKSLIEFLAE